MTTEHWYTPAEIARDRRISRSKIMAWIHSGELDAVNMATKANGRPRWRVSESALALFDAARSNATPMKITAKRRGPVDVTEYF